MSDSSIHPELEKAVHKWCDDAGVERLKIIIRDSDHLSAKTTLNGSLFLGNDLKKTLGQTSYAERPNSLIRSAVAHEVGHWASGHLQPKRVVPFFLTPYLGMASGVVALHLLKKYHEGEISDEEMKGEHRFKKGVVSAGQYLAAGALGMIGAKVMRRGVSYALEFEADAYATKLVGKDDMIKLYEALQRDHQKTLQSARKKGVAEWRIATYETLMDAYSNLTHPSFQERINQIRKLEPASVGR